MAQFDIHKNPRPGAEDVPYLLDIQGDFLDRLAMRLVVPLMPLARYGSPIERLNPLFEIAGEAHVGVFTEMAGIAHPLLGDAVASAAERRQEIVAAVDFMIRGFYTKER